jgi:hypothetical protein
MIQDKMITHEVSSELFQKIKSLHQTKGLKERFDYWLKTLSSEKPTILLDIFSVNQIARNIETKEEIRFGLAEKPLQDFVELTILYLEWKTDRGFRPQGETLLEEYNAVKEVTDNLDFTKRRFIEKIKANVGTDDFSYIKMGYDAYFGGYTIDMFARFIFDKIRVRNITMERVELCYHGYSLRMSEATISNDKIEIDKNPMDVKRVAKIVYAFDLLNAKPLHHLTNEDKGRLFAELFNLNDPKENLAKDFDRKVSGPIKKFFDRLAREYHLQLDYEKQ